MAAPMSFSLKMLFGGAIIAYMPEGLIDASDLRQVPDTQEVYLDPQSNVSLILEVVVRVEPNDLKDAAVFHFSSLAHDNEAPSADVLEVVLPEHTTLASNKTPSPVFLDGVQRVAKFNKTEMDGLKIFMALYRLPEQNVDLVFTANVPTVTSSKTIDDITVLGIKEAFRTCAKSLQIVDWGLFGDNSS